MSSLSPTIQARRAPSNWPTQNKKRRIPIQNTKRTVRRRLHDGRRRQQAGQQSGDGDAAQQAHGLHPRKRGCGGGDVCVFCFESVVTSLIFLFSRRTPTSSPSRLILLWVDFFFVTEKKKWFSPCFVFWGGIFLQHHHTTPRDRPATPAPFLPTIARRPKGSALSPVCDGKGAGQHNGAGAGPKNR